MGEKKMHAIGRKGGWLTMTAASVLLLGAGVGGKAYAADLGGGCCGDLEERVAELEATTARKGNRVVSLEISGQVNKALLFWDDGEDSDTFIVDPDSDGTRVRFAGKAKLKPGWEAGYTLEFNFRDAESQRVTQGQNGDDPSDSFTIRRNFWYVESERLGRLTLGQENQATDGINEIDVVATYSTVSKTHYAGNFVIRDGAGDAFRWQDVLGAIGGGQEDIVRYDTPSIYGFIASASWGDNNIWDVALRFQKQWNSVKIAAGIGYLKDDRENTAGLFLTNTDSQLSGSISAIHLPTGLFATFAAGSRDQRSSEEDATNLYFKGGISRRWLPYGDTTLWADYAKFEGFSEGLDVDPTGGVARLTSSEADVWGFGVVQSFDSAAMNVYALAQFFSSDLEQEGVGSLDTEDHFAIVVGSHLKF
jgi:predicted porin